MIHDLVQLPMRKMGTELSTMVPCFNGSDEIQWHGREINLSDISTGFFKYKTIEYSGIDAIERVFFTTEPIDINKRWWTTKIRIYPVFYKIYKSPIMYNLKAPVFRYLSGTIDILEICGHDACQQTYYDKLLKHATYDSDVSQYISKYDRKLIPLLVHGNDGNTLRDIAHMCDYDNVIHFPRYPIDINGNMFLREQTTTNDIGKFITPTCGSRLHHALVDMSATPFEITPDILLTETSDAARWTLHDLIQTIEESVYTDMYIKLVFKSAHNVEAHTEFYSKYIGLTPREPDGTETIKRNIVGMLRKWAHISIGTTPTIVELHKTWSEEIYVSIRVGTKLERYYFDLASYSLANLSFVDIFG